jgi:hypothetical protein
VRGSCRQSQCQQDEERNEVFGSHVLVLLSLYVMQHKGRRTPSERGLSRSSSEKHADGSAGNATMTIVHPFPRFSSHEFSQVCPSQHNLFGISPNG